MDTNNTAEMNMEFGTLDIAQLDGVSGGWGIPGWVKKGAHVVGSVAKTVFNPKAIEHGLIWGGAAAATASETGPGALVAGAGGFLAGYSDSQLSQHGG